MWKWFYGVVGLSVFLGSVVTLDAAERIVSLSPVTTELVCALGKGQSLVGVTAACDYPGEVKSVSRIGDFTRPSMERIIALRPTIVVGIGNPSAPEVLQLRRLNIRVCVWPSPPELGAVFQLIDQIGVAIRAENRARICIKEMRQALAKWPEWNHARISTVVVIWYPPYTVAGKTTFVADLVRRAGGDVAFGSSAMQFPQISAEQLIGVQPEVIIVADPAIVPAVSGDSLVKLTPAGKHNSIITHINPDWLLRPGPRCIQAIGELRSVYQSIHTHRPQ